MDKGLTMPETASTATLARGDLAGTPLRRDHFVPEAARDAAYHAAYDRTTLWYDAFWFDGRVILVTPRLLNLWPVLRGAEIRLDGRPARLRRRTRFSRHEILEIPARQRPGRVSVQAEGLSLDTPLSETGYERFAGRNVIVTISKDNPLEWFHDFARYHRLRQGAEAILFMDNGSTAYESAEIAQALQAAGLDAMVVEAPYPFGPVPADRRFRHKLEFFKPAMLNIARLRFLARARAVLNADIDELVWSEGASVFDMAANSRFGFAPFMGRWRNPGRDIDGPPRHADHVWEQDNAAIAPVKYAVAPMRPAGRFSWDVHRLEGLPLRSPFLRADAGYWHCSCITTGWKNPARHDRMGGDRIDAATCRALAAVWPEYAGQAACD